MVKSNHRNGSKKKGIKQGCPVSPFLFNIIINDVMKSTKNDFPRLILDSRRKVELPLVLSHVDDIISISETLDNLQQIINKLTENLKIIGLSINYTKSSIIVRDPLREHHPLPCTFKFNDQDIKVAKTIKYLGSTLTSGLSRPEIIRGRLHQSLRISRVLLPFIRRVQPPKKS
jgi:hypothetical protein